ncbi:ThiF family adenylyltransferase [Planctomycetota bacterium]
MRILQIGCGGIGSYLIQEISECIEQGQINPYTKITIADNDIAEIDQLKYQNFNIDEVGQTKAKTLAIRYADSGIQAINNRITKEEQLKNYDVIILCVDNERTREKVIQYCHKYGKEFIDLRATGRRLFAMPKEATLEMNMKYVDSQDMNEYSCQDQADLDKEFIQKGNKIVAMIGVQMLLNLLRGHNNKIISMVV